MKNWKKAAVMGCLAAVLAVSYTHLSLVGRLKVRPAFVVAKGGITSSDVGTKALQVKRAAVLGPVSYTHLDQEQFKALMSEYAGTIADKVDVILFAQGSMAYCEEYIHEKYGKVVLSSPRFGAAALKDALVKKGLM